MSFQKSDMFNEFSFLGLLGYRMRRIAFGIY